MKGSVEYMASSPRDLSSKLAASVVKTASALVSLVTKASLHGADDLSVERAWSTMDNSSYQGQKRADPTLALVKALRLAHDEAHDPVLWPTPEEELEERRRSKKRRGDSRDHRGGGSLSLIHI